MTKNLTNNKNNLIFEVRQQYFNNAGVNPKQGGFKEPERRSDESSQLYFGIVQSCCRSDRSFFYLFSMRQQKSEFGLSTKISNGYSTTSARNAELFKIIDEYFNYSGLGEPVKNLSTLLNCFLSTQENEEVGYCPTFLTEITFEVTRLNTFLASVYEEREYLRKKEVCHG